MCEDNRKHSKIISKRMHFKLSRWALKQSQGIIVQGPFNYCLDLSVIQLNHYKSSWSKEHHFIGGDLNEVPYLNFLIFIKKLWMTN